MSRNVISYCFYLVKIKCEKINLNQNFKQTLSVSNTDVQWCSIYFVLYVFLFKVCIHKYFKYIALLCFPRATGVQKRREYEGKITFIVLLSELRHINCRDLFSLLRFLNDFSHLHFSKINKITNSILSGQLWKIF